MLLSSREAARIKLIHFTWLLLSQINKHLVGLQTALILYIRYDFIIKENVIREKRGLGKPLKHSNQ